MSGYFFDHVKQIHLLTTYDLWHYVKITIRMMLELLYYVKWTVINDGAGQIPEGYGTNFVLSVYKTIRFIVTIRPEALLRNG